MGTSFTNFISCCHIKEHDIENLNANSFENDYLIIDCDQNIDPHFKRLSETTSNEKLSKTCLLLDPKYIRSDEKDWVKYSIRNTLEIYKNLVFNPEMKTLYYKENDPLYAKWNKKGWKMADSPVLCFHRYIMDISDVPSITLDIVTKLIYDIRINSFWDKNVKKAKILKEDSNSYIFHKVFKSPISFISERDRVDKQIVFELHDRMFALSTSCEETDVIPLVPDVIRMKNYLSLFSYYISKKGDERRLIFFGLNQVDAKMIFPDFIYHLTIPIQTKSWYNQLLLTMQVYEKDGFDGVKKILSK